ncbi:MAG: ABC-2 type transport system permease protein, partial [Saprospiraceae bacterium]
MFKHIFSFEFNQWFNKPLLYIYAIILGGIGLLSMGAAGGLFDGNTATVSSIKMINSPLQLCMSLGAYSYLAYLLLPSIIGATLQKDFDSNMFKVLYSYPFGKRDYIFGKFFSAFLIAVLIFFFIGIGTYIATVLSGVDQAVVVPFDFIAYLKTYVIWIIPNIFLFSAIVFAVTLYTRSIIAGFIALTAIFFVEGMTDVLLMDSDYEKFGALIDPFGLGALNNYTKYWTIIEQNENALPVFGMVLYNRLLWIGIALGIFFATYRWFTFSYTPKSFAFWKSKDVTKSVSTKPGGIIDITLPDTNYNYGVLHGLQSAWALTKIDLKYVLKGGPFIVVSIIGVLFIIIISAVSGQILQTSTLPVTREVLMIPGTMFSLLIALLTFIYAGLLFHRPETVNVYQLEDASAAPTWSLAVSKLWSITLMQVVLLGIIMVTGIAIQIYNGYYNFEIGQYLTELYGIRLINYVNWALLAILIYNLVPNFYLGLVVCMVLGIGFQFLSQLGVEQGIYKYNAAPGLRYSDMSGYGNRLGAHFMFKIYWLALGVFFFMLSILLWRRGVRTSLWHRIKGMKKRFRPILNILLIGSFLTFMGLGGWLYYQYNVVKPYVPSKLREERSINYEKEYKHYQSVAQPKIVDVTLNIDLVPESRDIKANGTYILVNKSGTPIDTVFVETTGLVDELNFSIQADIVTYDSINNVSIYHLPNPMQPGEEIELSFSLANEPNTLFHSESPVRSNGTFFNSFSFPVIGYLEMSEVIDKKVRLKYGLAEKDVMASPEDSVARMSNYISNNSDWIQFEATVSTSPDQIAMVPGKLQREWTEDGRIYFHYKMKSKMLHFYNVISAKYETYEDKWNDIPITIYYHKGHDYNLERIMKGAKAGLEYCSSNF